jgi:hypothetical protein
MNPSHGPSCPPLVPDITTDNGRLLALLFSLSTPGLDTVYHFDPTVERICVDTGASACISLHTEGELYPYDTGQQSEH